MENSEAGMSDLPGSFDGGGSVVHLSSSFEASNELSSDCLDFMMGFSGRHYF